MQAARADAIDHVKKRGLTVIPTDANMFMIDRKTRVPKAMQAAFRIHDVEIGRTLCPFAPSVVEGHAPRRRCFDQAQHDR